MANPEKQLDPAGGTNASSAMTGAGEGGRPGHGSPHAHTVKPARSGGERSKGNEPTTAFGTVNGQVRPGQSPFAEAQGFDADIPGFSFTDGRGLGSRAVRGE
ncbi:MAG TPA: hypothetical protein VH575_25220 [Gemmataceae bacterium]